MRWRITSGIKGAGRIIEHPFKVIALPVAEEWKDELVVAVEPFKQGCFRLLPTAATNEFYRFSLTQDSLNIGENTKISFRISQICSQRPIWACCNVQEESCFVVQRIQFPRPSPSTESSQRDICRKATTWSWNHRL